jgi:hypothetical protein
MVPTFVLVACASIRQPPNDLCWTAAGSARWTSAAGGAATAPAIVVATNNIMASLLSANLQPLGAMASPGKAYS